jgi:hypothetical protein
MGDAFACISSRFSTTGWKLLEFDVWAPTQQKGEHDAKAYLRLLFSFLFSLKKRKSSFRGCNLIKKYIFNLLFKSIGVVAFKVFFIYKYIKIIFFIFKKLFLKSIYQNNLKL